MREFKIKVPASSANIGPGFDVLGIALSLYLTLDVRIDSSLPDSVGAPSYCKIVNTGLGAEQLSTSANDNLITRVALYVLRCGGISSFPAGTHIAIHNEIPLGRGLGSSGAAVVAGVLLGNAVGHLDLSNDRLLDYCLMVERHPDNIAAAMFGGFVGSFLRELSGTDLERADIPLAEVLQPAGGIVQPVVLPAPAPPLNIAHYMVYPLASELRAVAIIPNFEVSTAKSRDVLPSAYTRQDTIYNLQRVAILVSALGQTPVNSGLIHLAMQDRLHQRYRRILVPGLSEILTSMTPRTHPGLVGICLSGAGPTVLALATSNFDQIAEDVINTFKTNGVECTWQLLTPAAGAEVTSVA